MVDFSIYVCPVKYNPNSQIARQMGIVEHDIITLIVKSKNVPSEKYLLAEATHRVKEVKGLGEAKNFELAGFPQVAPSNYFTKVKERDNYIDSTGQPQTDSPADENATV